MDPKRQKPTPTSIYNDEKKDLPAWMKTEDNRYDKYGERSSRAGASAADDKYSKYGGGGSRVVRRQPEERPKRTHPEEHDEDEGEDTTLAYSNLHVANPSSAYYQTFQSNIKNKTGKDINTIIRSHYNQRTYQSKYQGNRSKSPIIKLRNFNNIIKYILLGKYGTKLGDAHDKFTILDLCCGKGGDLNKCEFIQVDQYIGIDISDGSVKEAFSRYSKNKVRFIPRDGQRDSRRYNFEACFATGDLFQKDIPEILEPNFPGIIDELFPVDVVSAQFSLHYAFETEEKVKCIINNVSKSLKVGGKFIGTIPSSDFIKHKVKNHEGELAKMSFGNGLYKCTFHGTPPIDGDFNINPFGNGYNFSLKDAIDDVPEYVVPFETLRKICQDHSLVLKYSNNFIELFNTEIPNFFPRLNKKLVESIRRSDGKYGVEGLEKEAIQFYMGFVFEKV